VHEGGEADIPQSIAAHAEELHADVIVMCTHGRKQLRHRLFGSVAQAILGRGHTPVLLVPPPGEGVSATWTCRRVLVPVDARPEHRDALPVALEFARGCDAALHVLWVVPTLGTLGGDQVTAGALLPGTTSALLELEQEQAERQVAAQVTEAGAGEVPVTLEVVRGAAAEVILQTATRSDADLVVIGTHGRRGFDAFWAASVAPRVARRTMRPVLLVPLGSDRA
jgi:nucleotide-binding universal stress UspA family protein